MNSAAPAGLATLLTAALLLHSAAADDPIIFSDCDPRGMIPQGSSYWSHLGYALQKLGDRTPYTPYYSFKTRVGNGGDNPAFGAAYCQRYCSPAVCQACIRRLSSDIWRICDSARGARVEYPDCWIQYQDYYF